VVAAAVVSVDVAINVEGETAFDVAVSELVAVVADIGDDEECVETLVIDETLDVVRVETDDEIGLTVDDRTFVTVEFMADVEGDDQNVDKLVTEGTVVAAYVMVDVKTASVIGTEVGKVLTVVMDIDGNDERSVPVIDDMVVCADDTVNDEVELTADVEVCKSAVVMSGVDVAESNVALPTLDQEFVVADVAANVEIEPVVDNEVCDSVAVTVGDDDDGEDVESIGECVGVPVIDDMVVCADDTVNDEVELTADVEVCKSAVVMSGVDVAESNVALPTLDQEFVVADVAANVEIEPVVDNEVCDSVAVTVGDDDDGEDVESIGECVGVPVIDDMVVCADDTVNDEVELTADVEVCKSAVVMSGVDVAEGNVALPTLDQEFVVADVAANVEIEPVVDDEICDSVAVTADDGEDVKSNEEYVEMPFTE
jgi:hypothetical protein